MKLINSNIHLAIQGDINIFNDNSISHIENTFQDIFPSSEKVSDISTEDYKEIVYSINTPLLNNNDVVKEFYSDLEILLEELKEYEPHFTQFGGKVK